MLEAQFARQALGELRGLSHHQSNEIVGEQVNPELFDRHVGSAAAQPLHSHRGFDVAQVQFNVPSTGVEHLQVGFGGLLRVEQSAHQNLAPGAQFTNRQGVRRLFVVGLGHPVRFDDRLFQHDQVIARPQALTAAKVGSELTSAVLFEHRIDVACDQCA